jgi:hypothetical protein
VVAQSYFTSTEFGFGLGGSQYFGDLNENYGFKTVNAAGGIHARKHLNGYISIKAVANYTAVGYDDKYNTPRYQKLRNLNFKSDIYEFAIQAEFNFFKFITGDPYHRFTPFLTGGIGTFYYDPYTIYKGGKQMLRPLGTEGQYSGNANRKYDNFSPCFPVGVGIKFWLKGGVNLTLEIADRLTMTDYLDDVSTTYVGMGRFATGSPGSALQDRSTEVNPDKAIGIAGKQRGNSSSFDQYMIGMISISWHFTTYMCPEFMNTSEHIKSTRR